MTRKERSNIIARFAIDYNNANANRRMALSRNDIADESYWAGKGFAIAECYAIVFNCAINKALDDLSAQATKL